MSDRTEDVEQFENDWSLNTRDFNVTVVPGAIYTVRTKIEGKPVKSPEKWQNESGDKKQVPVSFTIQDDDDFEGVKLRKNVTLSANFKSDMFKIARAGNGGTWDETRDILPIDIDNKLIQISVSVTPPNSEGITYNKIDSFIPIRRASGKKKAADSDELPFYEEPF